MNTVFPGGVTEIDPKMVVANVRVAAYDVLPSQAGASAIAGTGNAHAELGRRIHRHQKNSLSCRPIRGPFVTFLVMKGAPYPDGDFGHSCVLVEDGGESKGSTCRR